MILRGVHLEHWACIEELTLAELPPGIVILHGPNRTGKSSLVRALRSCLFDYDHNSTHREVTRSIPRRSQESPKVVVEFDTAGERYRITKVFSQRKDGLALLERRTGSGWSAEVREPKEASRRVREILGSERSTTGLNQLLWLSQGEAKLPEAKSLDGSLQKKLADVLGALVTAGDLSFQEALDKRYKQRFTDAKGDYRKNSSVRTLEDRLREQRQVLDELERKHLEIEQVVRDMARNEDELPQLQALADQAAAELSQLNQQRETARERIRQHREAERQVAEARKQLESAQHRQEAHQAAKTRWQESESKLVRLEAGAQLALEEDQRTTRQHEDAERQLQDARQAEEAHGRAGDELGDYRALIALDEKRRQWDEANRRAAEIDASLRDLEQQAEGLMVPDQPLLESLQRNRRRVQELRARLRAAGLKVSIRVEQAAQFGLGLDHQPSLLRQLAAGEEQEWELRQQVEIELPGWGRVVLSRAAADQSLEQSAAELENLEREFQDTVTRFDEIPADETCLDRLAERRFRKQALRDQCDNLRKDLHRLAPRGLRALGSDLFELESQRRLMIDRRPALADWTPNSEEVTQREAALRARGVELQALRREREAAEAAARRAIEQTRRHLQETKERLAELRAMSAAAKEEWQRLGDETTLEAARRQAESELAAAELRLAGAQLTEMERTIDQHYQEAQRAFHNRQERLQACRDELNRLRGRMEGSEGLHNRRADAEAALLEIEQALDRERLEAEAHKHLRELFDTCRQSQVERVMTPVSGRVLEWSRYLGLDEYSEVRFGDQFLPDGLVLRGDEQNGAVALADESYGTEEQLSLLVRLALGGVLAKQEPMVAILDDPLVHADQNKHRRILEILEQAATGGAAGGMTAGPLQIVILTCHPERFDHLTSAHHIDLAQAIRREC